MATHTFYIFYTKSIIISLLYNIILILTMLKNHEPEATHAVSQSSCFCVYVFKFALAEATFFNSEEK